MSWHINGQYMETCNCNFVCPCIVTNLAGRPTEGDCKAAIAMRIDDGEKDGVKLDGVSFIVVLHSPGAMGDGDMTAGLIIDERATDAQVEAIHAIATGEAGGPMAALTPLISRLAGMERRPIRFDIDGMKHTVTAGDLVDQASEGIAGLSRPSEPIFLDNTCHPVNPKLGVATAKRSHIHAFGVDWDDDSGVRNGHFAPFSWAA
ncbi:MAG TPA: DUF1326 domain-containing protein [Pelomicrobium sp.]|nr:DUF1326 domain-containing protein [Pelomicrobium sp.]